MTNSNHQWLINGRPIGRPLADDDFKFVETPVVEPVEGEVLVRNLYLAFDPALKGHMENISNYVTPTQIGEVMRGSALAKWSPPRRPVSRSVIRSRVCCAGRPMPRFQPRTC